MTPTIHMPGDSVAPTPSSVPLMSAEEFFPKYENHRAELVRGVVKELPMPGAEHGYICSEIAGYLRDHVKKHELGRVMVGDPFVRIPGNPETVRGADALFISYARWPKERKIPLSSS
jgi:Uma2 family endonuclease